MRNYNIVVITSEYLLSYVSTILDRIGQDCSYEILSYHCFEDLPIIYSKNEKQADGFLISGAGAKAALLALLGRKPSKPIHTFQIDGTGLYKTLLDIFVGENSPSPARVYLDFMIPVVEDATVQYFLRSDPIETIGEKIDVWLASIDGVDSLSIEEIMIQRILALRKSGKLDLIICQYSSIIPRLKEECIPLIYPFPDRAQIKKLLDELLLELKLRNAQDAKPAAIAISARGDCSQDKLMTAVDTVVQDLALDAIRQVGSSCCFLIGTRKLIDYLTDELNIGLLNNLLEEKITFPVAIGYGLGNDLADAKSNAQHALREARFKRGDFIVDDNYHLIGPLGRNNLVSARSYSHEKLYEIASKCKLSTLTIQKLLTIITVKKNKTITAGELAEKMNMTLRNANRILKHVQQGGFAQMVHTRSLSSKGRPVAVYELSFPV